MKRSRFTEEQITFALRQHDAGTAVEDICRQLGISQATFYVWKKKYAHMGVSELRELRLLRDENARLKRLVADLTLDKQILSDVVKKRSEASAPQSLGGMDKSGLPCEHPARLRLVVLLARRLVPVESGQGSVGIARSHPGDRAESPALWLPAHSRDAAP